MDSLGVGYGEEAGADLLVEARDELLAQRDREAAEAEALLGLIAVWKAQGQRAMEHARRAVELLAGFCQVCV